MMATILSPEDWERRAKSVDPGGSLIIHEEKAKYAAEKREEMPAETHLPLERRKVSDEAYRRIYEQAARDLELIRHGD